MLWFSFFDVLFFQGKPLKIYLVLCLTLSNLSYKGNDYNSKLNNSDLYVR